MVRNSRAEEHFSNRFEGRTYFLLMIVICAFLFLVFNLWKVQVLKGSWFQELSKNNRIRKIVIPSPRGTIYDRKGIILADNRPSFDIEIIIEDIPKDKKIEISKNLASILDISQKKILKKIQLSRRVPYVPEKIARDVSIDKITKIQEVREKFPGISTVPVPIRNYRFGNHASHLIGYIGKLTSSEYKSRKDKGYHIQDYIGKLGIERVMETQLKGIHGGMQVQVDNRGYTDEYLGVKDPIPGNSVYLTIDHHLQIKAESLLEDKTGAIVVMDTRNGDVLALASSSSFDPNLFVKPTPPEIIRELFQSKNKYLINKATREQYPPGSTFKILVAIAALELGGLTVVDKYYCNGAFDLGKFTFHCWFRGGHGHLTIIEAIRYSCNVFFYNLGHKVLGVRDIHHWCDEFGFGKKTGIDLDREIAGVNPSNAWKRKTFGEPWYPGDTINLCIGQGYILVTPLQLACYVTAIANGGKLFKPKIIDKIISNTGKVIKSYTSEIKSEIKISSNTLKIVQQGMKEVVQHKYGTGIKARVKGHEASGKTGTIQMGTADNRIHHAWFMGYTPSDKPEISVVILIENAESGGTDAAPVAKEIFKYYYKNLGERGSI